MRTTPAQPFVVRVPTATRDALKNRPAPSALQDFGITELSQQQSTIAAVRAYLDQNEALPAEPVGRTEGVALFIQLDERLAAELIERAKSEGRPKGHVVRAALDLYLA